MSTRRSITAFLAVATTLQLAALASPGSKTISALPAPGQAVPSKQSTDSQKQFDKLVDTYFDAAFKWSPSWGTDVGFHQYDNDLNTWSQDAVNKRVAELNGFLTQLQGIDPKGLDKTSRLDRKMLMSDANAGLLELQHVQNWKRNPDMYSSHASSSVFTLMRRHFASPEQRLASVVAREKLMPQMFTNARQNLSNTPKIYTQVALEQLPGIISFFKDDVPAAFTDVKDATLKSEFDKSNGAVVAELQSYQQFLKDTILPKSLDQFAIGKDNYQKKLLYEEMVDEPVDSLLAEGYTELHRLQKEFIDTAKSIDPNKPAAEVFLAISSDHPQPTQLISSVSDILNSLREQSSTVVTIPSADKLQVEETPPFMRATTFASMDTPGAFEKVDRLAYYQVTLPEKNWSPQRTEEHMRFFSTRDVINTSVHEAYPGHFVQGLWILKAPSKTRKLLGCGTNSEGWAHYCEQMMVDDEGLGKKDPKLKMVQIHDALLRACRYIVGIRMHTQGMTLDEGKQFFIKEGYMEEANADREAKRGTMDPTYCVYTLGKLQILSLRDDYKKKMGSKFSLKDFHDKFLAQGCAPIKIVREAIIETEN